MTTPAIAREVTEQDVATFFAAAVLRIQAAAKTKRVHLGYYAARWADGISDDNHYHATVNDHHTVNGKSVDEVVASLERALAPQSLLARAAELRREADRIEAEAKLST